MSPGVYPRSCPRATRSKAEEQVWRALQRHLPTGWYAWHSLSVRTREGRLGEGDFILAHPARGFLVMEVKGGVVRQEDGLWFQNGKRMKRAPLDQARDFAHHLEDRLEEEDVRPPAFDACVCLPDTRFEGGPSQDDLRDAVLGARDLARLDVAFPELAKRLLDRHRQQNRGQQKGNWVRWLHELWGETWVPTLGLGARLQDAAESRVQLDADQVALLDQLEGSTRMLVEGGAGSGKTLLAREVARKLAVDGRRVLLLTFTEPLAHWLGMTVQVPGVVVAPIRRHAIALLERVGMPVSPPSGAPEWEEVSLRAAVEALPRLGASFDAVVVDEAQDLSEEDWTLVRDTVRDGVLWAFHDPAQRYWPERQIPDDLFPARYRLPRTHRCQPAIQALADAYAGKPLDEGAVRAGLEDGTIGVLPSGEGEAVRAAVAAEIDRLVALPLRPGDIAIASLRGLTAPSDVRGFERLGRHPVVAADHPDMATHVVVDSFLRLKGLERVAVLVADLGGQARRKREVRMHVAVTRAFDLLRIVGSPEALAEDPILAKVMAVDSAAPGGGP